MLNQNLSQKNNNEISFLDRRVQEILEQLNCTDIDSAMKKLDEIEVHDEKN